jgi:hypothetical protein
MLSKLNYYDSIKNPLVFTNYIGLFEDISDFSSLYIFIDTSGNDNLTIQYSNTQIQNNENIIEQSTYVINNTSQYIYNLPKLKYFRIKINSGDFSSNIKRIYYTFFQKEIPTNLAILNNLNVSDLLTHNHLYNISNILNNMSLTDISSYNILNNMSLTDISSYNTLNNMSLTDISSYNTLNNMSLTDISSYNTLNNISLTDISSYNTLNNISLTDISSYNILNNMSLTDISSYNTLNNISLTDISSYNILNNILTNGIKINGTTDTPIQTDNSGFQIMKFYPTNTDAFSRLRVSFPFTIFEGTNINYKSTKFTESVSGNANISYNINTSTVNLNITGIGHAIREGKTCAYYQPGKSLFSMFSFCMDEMDENLRQMVGYYDCSNGLYLDVCGTSIYFTKRTYINNIVEEIKVEQNNWNKNTLLLLDTSKSQILWIDIEWLGVGSVRMGFIIDGEFILCHQFNHANVINSVFITSANLPPRYEIISTGNITKTLKSICCTILSEGGFEFRGIKNIIDTGTTQISLTNRITIPLIALRINPLYLNAIVIPSLLSLLPISNGTISYKLLMNPTITVSEWTSYSSTSQVQYALASSLSNLSGGTIFGSGYSNNASIIDIGDNKFDLQLGRRLVGINIYTTDIIVLCAIALTNNQHAYAMIGWNEF